MYNKAAAVILFCCCLSLSLALALVLSSPHIWGHSLVYESTKNNSPTHSYRGTLYMGLHAYIPEYHNKWGWIPMYRGTPMGCIAMYWSTPTYRDAYLDTDLPISPPPYTGVPCYLEMHHHIPEYHNEWRWIAMYWETPMGCIPMGYPEIWACIPAPEYPKDASPLSRVHDLVQTTPTQTLAIHVQT